MSTAVMRELSPDILHLPEAERAQVEKVAARLLPVLLPEAQEKEEYARSVEGMGAAVKEAANKGYTVIKGEANTLLLDLDDGAELNQANFKLMCELLHEYPFIMQWKSKSGSGIHMVLKFEKTTFTPAEAVALEASLGSDLKRTMLYVMRLKNKVPEPRCLFKPPYTVAGGYPESLTFPLGTP